MTISHRAEQAAPDEARGLLEELWFTIHEMLRPTDSSERIEAWRVFQRLLDINTPEAHLAAAMMLGGDRLSLYMSEAMPVVAKELALHCRIAKPEDEYAWKLTRALITAIARSVGQ